VTYANMVKEFIVELRLFENVTVAECAISVIWGSSDQSGG
jgi:hypothetical protein